MTGHSSLPSSFVRPPRWHVVWPLAMMVMIFFASGEKDVAAPGFIPHMDKISHFSIFGLLATLVLRLFFDERRRVVTALIATIFVSTYGIADEYRQSFTPGRFVEFSDWLADTTGAMIAVSVYAFWDRYRQFLERPVRRMTQPASSGIAPGRASDEPFSAR